MSIVKFMNQILFKIPYLRLDEPGGTNQFTRPIGIEYFSPQATDG
jgi:hypothetical protein